MHTDAPAWRDLERIVVAGSLGELELEHATAKMCRTITGSWGPSCSFVKGRPPAASPNERIVAVAKHEEASAAVLILGRSPELDEGTLTRMSRLFQLLLEALDPYPKLHQLRNRLSGVLLNVELVEMLLKDAPEFGEARIGREQRVQILTAIGHARRASSDVVDLVRGMADPESPAR